MDYSKLPIFAESQVVVCGGGTAGAFAAIASAEMGKSVLIVEQLGSLGGTATNGLVCPVMHTHIPENPNCSYIANRVRERLKAYGACSDNGFEFDPLMLKVVLEELCSEAKVNSLFHTFIADTVVEDGKLKYLVVANKKGLGLIKGDIFIDATGDADVCVRAGAEYTQGNPIDGKNQPISLRYIVSGVDFKEFGQFIWELNNSTGKYDGANYDGGHGLYVACCNGERWAFGELFDKAIANGDLTPDDRAYWQGFSIPGRKDCMAFNSPEFFECIDGTNPEHLTKTQIDGKKRILGQLKFCKKYLRGFENAYISEIAQLVGIRESRNVVCEYMLTAEDLLCRRKFDDMFCQSNYPVDIHGKTLDFNINTKPVDDGKIWYEIPYLTLVVKGFDNLMVAGRALGAEFLAQSSLRVQQSVRASGEAAGIAAALALNGNIASREVNGKAVREIMIEKGADFVL